MTVKAAPIKMPAESNSLFTSNLIARSWSDAYTASKDCRFLGHKTYVAVQESKYPCERAFGWDVRRAVHFDDELIGDEG